MRCGPEQTPVVITNSLPYNRLVRPPLVSIHPYYFSLEKRLFDVVLSGTLLVLGWPLLILLGLIVYKTAGWPIIFGQTRLGKHKKPFVMYKFRTMHKDAELVRAKYLGKNEAPYPMFKLANDPRFVGYGHWLSHTGLDELPQLWNILRGEMSFVGPRPLPAAEARLLSNAWDFRYRVRPGIFSEWSAAKDRHESLVCWIKLDAATVYQGNHIYDLLKIFKVTLQHAIFLKFFL